ncbi:MAG: hypothetical protein IKR35_04645, partial [Lachnospiraceae bacterium]|nr:hypothetical protein [Lachnospiraceae bacterium]
GPASDFPPQAHNPIASEATIAKTSFFFILKISLLSIFFQAMQNCTPLVCVSQGICDFFTLTFFPVLGYNAFMDFLII